MSFFSSSKVWIAAFSLCSVVGYSHASEEGSAAKSTLSGNIGLVSKYVYRGSVENNDLALQGGLDYSHQSGLMLGYWGSTLDYDPSDDNRHSGFENDFYIGYGRELGENWSVSSQLYAYFYHRGGSVYSDDGHRRITTGTELVNTVNYKDLSVGVAVALSDVNYANAGDVYMSVGYSYGLPYDFALNTLVGANVYNSSRDDALMETSESLTLNEIRFGVSKSFTDVGINLSLDYIWGGKDRINENLDDNLVFAVNYSF